jgi:signal transduction histidine kinase/HD-like signal output (HDOD) protein
MKQGDGRDLSPQIELILRQIETLPTLSPVATRLLEIAGAEDADLDRIVEIIESDPALTARMLGLCRRADKGWGDRITTVRRAVVMLGLEAVQAAALSVAVYDVMESYTPDEADDDSAAGTTLPFDREGFWRFSIATASASELIAEVHPELGVAPEEAFVAGLLHGLGKLILDLILPRSYGRVLALSERRQSASPEAEQTLLGVDHHTAGKRLAEHWGMPYAIQDVMWLYGQRPGSIPDLPHRPLIGLVSVARTLCRHLHIGWSGDFNHPEPLDGSRGVCAAFAMDPLKVDGIAERLHDGVLHRCQVLGLDDRSTPQMLLRSVTAANQRLGRLTTLFEQRSRQTHRQTRVLAAVSDFHGNWRPGRGVVDTLGEVVRSAAAFAGAGFYATIYQPREGDPWQLCQFNAEGRLLRTTGVDTPPDSSWRPPSLARICEPGSLSVGALSILPWLTDYLVDAGDLRRVQILPLRMGEGDQHAAAALLHDRDMASLADRAAIQALVATRASGVVAAAQHDGARKLGERLASANRTLADTQARLSEAQSMARLGEMAAGAAHEMNNPLTVISGRAQLLATQVRDDQDRTAARAIADAAQQLSDLITSLRLVAAPPTPNLTTGPVCEWVAQAVRQGRERAAAGEESVQTVIDGRVGSATVDADLLASALAEVIANALQAGGEAPVEVRVQMTGSDSRISISVTDQGAGMTPRALQHAFDPFFSDKPAGRRTGLGLTRARTVVELHGGEISLSSRPGEGASATITLPLTPALSPTGPAETPRPARPAA